MRKLPFLTIFFFVIIACSKRNDLEVFVQLNDNKNEKLTSLKVFFVNNTDKDYYVVGFNPFLHIRFVDCKGVDISEKIWENYIYRLEVPGPNSSYKKFHSESLENEELFVKNALYVEFDSVQIINNVDLSLYKNQILELVRCKYDNVLLVRKRSRQISMEFSFNDLSSLSQIFIKYDYNEIYSNVPKIFIYNVSDLQVSISNYPISKIDEYCLYKGVLKNELQFERISEK